MEQINYLTIPRDLTIQKLNELTAKIYSTPNIAIRVGGKGIKFGGSLGLEAHLIQLLATWSRRSSTTVVRTYISKNNVEKGFADLCQSFSGMACLALSDAIYLDDGITPVSKSYAFESAKRSVDCLKSFNFAEAFKGRRLFFPCLKPSLNNGFISPLYDGEKVSSEGEFKYIMQEALISLLRENQVKSLGKKFFINVGSVVHELFKNTHEHAQKDENGNYLAKSVRGISLAVNHYSKRDITNILGRLDGNYSKTVFENASQRANLYFLEISVVDTGVGYSKSWYRGKNEDLTNISIKQELEAIRCCFTKHGTTKSIKSAGSGLTLVLNCLANLNAGFRLRTGKTLITWLSSEHNGISERNVSTLNEEHVGVSFTCFIPLIFNKDE